MLRAFKFLSTLAIAGLMMVTQSSQAAEVKKGALVPAAIMAKINVSDLERSATFYSKVIGLKEVARVDLPAFKEVILTQTGDPYEAAIVLLEFKEKKPLVMGTAFNTLVFVTHDIKAMAQRVKDGGGTMGEIAERSPSPLPTVSVLRVAHGKDPDGYGLELLEMVR
jgi:predicted enzyme related to lactoylglutathione lyase